MNGNILDIKKFTVHDGPGIRSTVFLKGCPLRCAWCQNPEGMEKQINLWYFPKKCIGCHRCIQACPNKALTAGAKRGPIRIDRERCVNRGCCVAVCPTTALCFDGKEVSVDEVVATLAQDKPFYDQSGGGITLSGGDPLFQAEFALEILKACQSQGIHTAIETCMHSQPPVLEKFLNWVDLFIVDLKLFDSGEHQEYTGVDNRLIQANFRFLAAQKDTVLVRIPLIPGVTATKENLGNIAGLVHQANPNIPIELMNFNPLAEHKYRLMGKDPRFLGEMRPFSEVELDEWYRLIADQGIATIRDIKFS